MQIEQERKKILNTLSDLDTRILEQDKVAVKLRTLYDYCQDVAQNLTSFDFDGKRLALEALGVQVIANGRNWELVANIPLKKVAQVKTASLNCSNRI